MTYNILKGSKMSVLPLLNRHGKEIYSFQEIVNITKMDVIYARKVLHELERAGRLARIEKGKYLFVPEGFESSWSGSNLLIASKLASPYALAYWTALNYWQLTEQIPGTVFVQSTKRKFSSAKEVLSVKYKFITIKKERFFGLVKVWLKQHELVITDKEKTILDCLAYPEYCAGIIEPVKGIINGLGNNEIDIDKLIRYAEKFGNKTVFKRLGYILETIIKNVPESKLRLIKKHSGMGYSLLDPTLPEKGKFLYKWQLILNVSEKSLTDWQVT